MLLRSITISVVVVGLAGCAEPRAVRTFPADSYPQKLSEWGVLLLEDDQLTLGPGVVTYDINTPLFTDYAQKLRTVWLPAGAPATYHAEASFDFPVGTVVSKTFFYPRAGAAPRPVAARYDWPDDRERLPTADLAVMETRLLVRQQDGWDALPYVWQGDDAYLRIAGDLEMLDIVLPGGEVTNFPYVVPTRNECASCHATNHTSGELVPIGLKARHLNRGYRGGPGNQLTEWRSAGRLDGLPAPADVPANAAAGDTGAPLADRARAYLDANCGHCHNEDGAADTSGLILDSAAVSMRELGVCKPPIAAGGGSGGHAYSIVPGAPDESILIYRLEITDPGKLMPEIGRSLVHAEGVALLREWVATLDGECVEATTD